MAPSSLPVNRSTPRSQVLVPFPPSGSSRQTFRTRGAAPGGDTLTRSPGDPSVPEPEPNSTTDPRRDPTPPFLPAPDGARRTRCARHTVPVPHPSASVARRRRRNRVRPGPSWCFVRSTPDRPLSRSEPFRPRHLCACGRPAVPRGDQRGLGPPRTRLGGFTRLSTLLLRSSPRALLRWFAGPSGSDSPCRVRRGSILDCGGSAVNPRGGKSPVAGMISPTSDG